MPFQRHISIFDIFYENGAVMYHGNCNLFITQLSRTKGGTYKYIVLQNQLCYAFYLSLECVQISIIWMLCLASS